MKNNNVDIKSLIIGFLMATCMMMALGFSKSMPDELTITGELTVSNSGSLKVSQDRAWMVANRR